MLCQWLKCSMHYVVFITSAINGKYFPLFCRFLWIHGFCSLCFDWNVQIADAVQRGFSDTILSTPAATMFFWSAWNAKKSRFHCSLWNGFHHKLSDKIFKDVKHCRGVFFPSFLPKGINTLMPISIPIWPHPCRQWLKKYVVGYILSPSNANFSYNNGMIVKC